MSFLVKLKYLGGLEILEIEGQELRNLSARTQKKTSRARDFFPVFAKFQGLNNFFYYAF